MSQETYEGRNETDAAWDSAEHNARRAERDEAECARLKTEVEDLTIRLKRWQHNENQIGTNAQVKRLQAEVERLREDAERWRKHGTRIIEAYDNMQKESADLWNRYGSRLLTLATKYCPSDHHDWQEILNIGKAVGEDGSDG